MGLSDGGIDFDAPDGQPAHALFFLVTPLQEPDVQLALSANIAHIFRNPESLEHVLSASNFTEFLATLKTLEPKEG